MFQVDQDKSPWTITGCLKCVHGALQINAAKAYFGYWGSFPVSLIYRVKIKRENDKEQLNKGSSGQNRKASEDFMDKYRQKDGCNKLLVTYCVAWLSKVTA